MITVRIVLLSAACAVALTGSAVARRAPAHRVPVHHVPSQSVSVQMDNVTLVSFKRPVSTVYIGNPSIAELTVVDQRHVFVLGKRFGATNLIALGVDKSLVENDPVTVSSRRAEAVTVFRGPETYNYICAGVHCETRPVPGDQSAYFTNTEGEAKAHDDTAKGGGGAGTNNSQQGIH